MPTSFFTNGGHLSPRTMHTNNAQGRSSALSQYSDDASIYSSTFVTRTAKNHPSNFLAITPEPIASKTPHESEMPWLNDYSGSKLHVNDQSKRSSMSSLDQDDGNTLEGNEQEDDVPRMSVLGPSLRFHSRAPWELEGDDIDEEEEADYGVLLASSIKSRPSADSSRSSRSQAKSQRSFETTSSQVHPRGALYALAQESLSTSSLGSSSGQAPSLTAFSLARVRSESAGTSSSTTLGVQSSNSIPSKGLSPNAAGNSRGSNSRKPPKSETSHPYANPAFALSHESTSSMDQNPSATVIRSDSITTVTEPTPSQTASGSKLHTVPSLTSLNFRRKQSAPSIHGKEISHPVAISNSTTHLDDAASIIDIQHSSTATSPKASHFDNIPGWTDRGVPAPFNLISLEEARAQRSRAGTQSSAPHSHTPFPDSLPLPNKRPTADSYDLGLEPHRVRSTSGNGKPKTTLASLVSMSSPSPPKQDQVSAEPSPSNTGPPSGKTIKPRKSGFLRIFGGRASAEKEDKTPTPPPLPPLVTDASQLPWSKRGMIPRSPVHEFVPTFSTSSDDFALSPTETSSHVWPESTSPKRSGPPLNLSINTRSPVDGKTRSSTLPDRQVSIDVATSPVSPQAMPKRPWVDSTQPQSAPANMTEFPALKLRPVSTFFSSQLQDFLDADTSSPEEPITPASATPSNIVTPITPISSSGRSEPSQQKAMHKVDHSPKPSSFKRAESVTSSEYSWQQQHVRDLEVQIRNLQAELKELRSGQYCSVCGRGDKADEQHLHALKHQSIVHRPRAPTGNNTARFVNNLT